MFLFGLIISTHSVLPIPTVTTIGPSPPASDTSSTDSISPVIPAVIVVVVVFLIVAISGVICYKRRQLSRSKDRDPHLDAPTTVLNPSFTTSAMDQNDNTECVNPIEGASNVAMPLSSEDNQHNEYFELPTSVPPTRQGNMVIYNEVGEQDYNVLFGGKEQGDYHEYNLPETAEKTQSGPYQDLMKDRIKEAVTSPTDTLLKGVEHALNDDNDKIFQPQNKGAPTERDSHAYQDLREDDSNYTSVLRDDGTPTSPGAKHFVPAMNHISKTQTLQDQDEEYTELPSLVSPTNHDNGDIYNELGEQDYNVLFGGKEQGDYHEYNLPDSAQKTPNGPYQELLKGRKQDLHCQTKRGIPNETVDQGYQDLRKDETDYTSLHLNAQTPTKPESSSSVASMNNTYQALQTSGPDYAILEPNTNNPSPAYPKPGSLPNNDYQSLAKNETGSDDTARGFDQGGESMKQEALQDNTYQHLIKDDNSPESMNGNTEATEQDKDSTYDVLQHGPKTSGHPPSNGYGSLGMTTETGDLDNDYPGAEPKATSDYEVPKQDISEEPYDHLQRKELSETSPINPGIMTDKSADGDDYENPSGSLVDETNNYQTLDNRQYQGNEQDGVDEDYSHLQRPPENTVSPGRTGASDMGNQYGKLNFAYDSK
ncbi:uncharacterized protein LOC105444335 [Strongylocentrotus purpuratus]|uniref:Uncharacterized protein n=1 Tax=Strongylocentrotus purpuratus TaxID=7668 RepID=A0A7M7HNE7_STRPU|nr:uncharacterized protein LOC105444335 [Strongylocentrotus purpuratus]